MWDLSEADPRLVLFPAGDGWFSLDAADRYRGDRAGLLHLAYIDADEAALRPTVWFAEDLPELRAAD